MYVYSWKSETIYAYEEYFNFELGYVETELRLRDIYI